MEMDTRTMQNPVSENGWIFDKVYDLLKFLRQFEFETGGMDDTISRQAAIDAVRKAKDKSEAHRMLVQLPSAQPGWIPCSEKLPEENVYVLVWCGEVKIARIIRGISKEQRAKMQEGVIDDPVSWGWNLSNGYFEVKRSESYRTCDEYCNNKVPYCWDCIYGEMFGQDVKAWMPLPAPYQ